MPFDEKDKAEMVALIVSTVGGALADDVFVKNVGRIVKAQVDAGIGALDLDAKIKAAIPKPSDPVDPVDLDDEAPVKGKSKAGDDAVTRELKKLRAQNEESEKARVRAIDEAKSERERFAAESRKMSIRDALIANGADPKKVPVALNHLLASGSVKVGADGKAVFATQTKWGPEDLDPTAGTKAWLDSDEGKMFLPPIGNAGTGTGVGGNGKQPASVSAESILSGIMARGIPS